MQMLQNNLLIAEQVSEPISLYALANIMKQHVTQPDTHSPTLTQYMPD